MDFALSPEELEQVVAGTTAILDNLQVDYAIMGGAAVSLLTQDPGRQTVDVDLVIGVDHRQISAEGLCQTLLKSYENVFAPINQYGVSIPAYKLSQGEGRPPKLVELEVFDAQSWPQRPQYNLQMASRVTRTVLARPVKIFSPAWLLREKILAQDQREGSSKAVRDIEDVASLVPFVSGGQPELNFDQSEHHQAALRNLVQKDAALATALRQVIQCAAVFGNE